MDEEEDDDDNALLPLLLPRVAGPWAAMRSPSGLLRRCFDEVSHCVAGISCC